MRKKSLTQQPKFQTKKLLEGDLEEKRTFQQVKDMLGIGICLQDETGKPIPVQIKNGQLQSHDGKGWRSLGQAAAPISSPSSGPSEGIMWGANSGLCSRPFTFSSTFTLSALTSELLKVGATGVVAEAVEGTDYAGIDFANVFTAAQKVNVNSATALLVEQDGVKDNTLVVDTASGLVGIGTAPTAGRLLNIKASGQDRLLSIDEAVANAYTGSDSTIYGAYISRYIGANTCPTKAYNNAAILTDAGGKSTGAGLSIERVGAYNNLVMKQAISGTASATCYDYGTMNYLYYTSGMGDTSSAASARYSFGMYNYVLPAVFAIDKTGATFNWYLGGIRNVVTAPDPVDYSAGTVNLRGYGIWSDVTILDLGSGGVTQAFGHYAYVHGDAANCGFHAKVDSGTTNWSFYAESGNWAAAADNQKILFGTGLDAYLTYNATDLVCMPDYVGTGRFVIDVGTAVGQEAFMIQQDDADQAFINWQGTSAADVTKNITTRTVATVKGFVLVEVGGAQGWMAIYNAPTS